MFTPIVRTTLVEHFEKLTTAVELVSAVDDTSRSAAMVELLDELASMSDSITHRTASGGEMVPSFTVGRPSEPPTIRFAGTPGGHEFSSLVLALLHVGGVPPKVDSSTRDRILNLGPHEFMTLYSQSCQNCPDVVQAFNILAALNPAISHTAVDGAAFPDIVASLGVKAVPSVYQDDTLWWSGRGSLEEILDKLDGGVRLVEQEPYDVLIVGGGPAGVAAAVYAARKGVRTAIIADRFGGQVLDTAGIENFIGTNKTTGPQLAAQLQEHVDSHQIDVVRGKKVADLTPGGVGGIHTVTLTDGSVLFARTVIIATGASWRTLGVPGEDVYRNKGVTFCPHCDGPLFSGKDVAVVGGGNSGVEAALDLAGLTRTVTLLELGPELRADAVLREALAATSNIEVMTSASTTAVVGDGEQVTGLTYTTPDGTETVLPVDGVFVQVGLIPNTTWLADIVERNRQGEIVIDSHGATSIPGVFAAGDCTTVPYKQIVVATGAGATAALGAFDYLLRHRPSGAESVAGTIERTKVTVE